jgi:hypothetical protein
MTINTLWIVCICASIVIISISIAKSTVWEKYDNNVSIITQPPYSRILDVENRKCKLVDRTIFMDSVEPYELLQHSQEQNVCYVHTKPDMDEATIDMTCKNILRNAGGGGRLVGTKILDPVTSPYISSGACVFKFDGSNEANTMARFLNSDDFRVTGLAQNISSLRSTNSEKTKDINTTFEQSMDIKNSKIPDVNKSITKEFDENKVNRDAINNEANSINQTNAKIPPLEKNTHVLFQGVVLHPNIPLINQISGHRLMLNSHGEFVLWRVNEKGESSRELWKSRKNRLTIPPYRAVVTPRGDFWVLDRNNVLTWFATQRRHAGEQGPYRVVLRADGKVVLHDNNKKVLWQHSP